VRLENSKEFLMFLGFNREGGFGLFKEGSQMNLGKN